MGGGQSVKSDKVFDMVYDMSLTREDDDATIIKGALSNICIGT